MTQSSYMYIPGHITIHWVQFQLSKKPLAWRDMVRLPHACTCTQCIVEWAMSVKQWLMWSFGFSCCHNGFNPIREPLKTLKHLQVSQSIYWQPVGAFCSFLMKCVPDNTMQLIYMYNNYDVKWFANILLIQCKQWNLDKEYLCKYQRTWLILASTEYLCNKSWC